MPAFAWKDQTEGSYQMQGEPRLCQTLVLRSGIQAQMSAGAIRALLVSALSADRHCTYSESSNSMRQMLSSHTPPWAASRCLREYGHPRQPVSRD